MVGRPQKQVSQLQNRRADRVERRTFPIAVPHEPLVAPPAPRGLKAAGKVVWEQYWTDPVSCAATRADGYDIAQYCALHDRLEGIAKAIEKEGDVTEGMNGPILNPLWRAYKIVEARIAKYREQLGILPLARMRLGLVQTQREIGVADLRRRLDRSDEARGAIEAECSESDVNLDEL